MNLIIMLLLISVLIIVHELGHFLSAKLFKIKVDKFGIGLPIGPTLYEKQIGDTKFLIHAFLLGGYVSFPDDDENCELPKWSPLRFENKPIYQRAIVIASGVIANVLAAYLLVFLTATMWGKLPLNNYDIYVSKVLPNVNQQLQTTNLKPKDRIIKINGANLEYPSDINLYASLSKKYDNETNSQLVKYHYNELKKLNPKLNDEGVIEKGTKVILPKVKPEDEIHLAKDVKLGVGKFKSNDDVVLTPGLIELRNKLANKKKFAVDGNYTMTDLSIALSDSYHPINLTVMRDGKEVNITPIVPTEDGVIGIEKEIVENFVKTKTIKGKIIYTNKYLYENTYMMLYGLGKMFAGKVPLKDLHGIVAITKIGSDIIEYQGLFKGLLLTAVISLNLAIVNILPIPALDGGHLLFLAIEKIKGQKVNEKTLNMISNACFLLLIVLMLVVVFNDILGLVTNKF